MGAHQDNPPQAPVEAWLRAGDWPRVHAHFQRHPPDTAAGFEARALALIQSSPSAEQRRQAIADLQQAVALKPDHLLYRANLTQALIDLPRPAEAVQAAQAMLARWPDSAIAAEKHCLALHAAGRWNEALQAALRAEALAQRHGSAPPEPLRRAVAELASRWWEPLTLGGITLRLPTGADQPFIHACFSDAAFMARYHRFQRHDESSIAEFVRRASRRPAATGRHEWIVLDRGGQPAGLTALVDIDLGHRRGELLVGLPRPSDSANLALKAALAAMVFGFERLSLEKLVSYVYGDNPWAQRNTRHLGFTEEGLLRAHLLIGNQRLDLRVNGLLSTEFAADQRLQRMRARWT
ncbi:MAG TPA: GNAT family N-acetyltransferase [Solimonas sp.]|nr:GNAT family N-acetyltransferase [Solimonas sp.]